MGAVYSPAFAHLVVSFVFVTSLLLVVHVFRVLSKVLRCT